MLTCDKVFYMESVAYYNLLHIQPYAKILQLQQRLHALRIEDQIDDLILLLEHRPVITLGRSPDADSHVLNDPIDLKHQGIEVCRTNRGGDVTYHGPGQLIVYFILRLPRRDIRWFIQHIEQSVISTLAKYHIQGAHHPDYPGVWVGAEKICALGIYVRKWVTMHGIALNVHPSLSHFTFIIPCGIQDKGVTSIQNIYQRRHLSYQLTMAQVKQDYLESFSETFQITLYEQNPEVFRKHFEVCPGKL